MNQNNTTDQTNETILSSDKKHCRKCGVELDRNNCSAARIGRHDYICRICNNKKRMQLWRKANPDKVRGSNTKSNRRRGNQPFDKNTHCSLFLGVYIAERVLYNTFKNIEKMPHGNPGYDFICGNGYLIDVKSSCKLTQIRKSPAWFFNIKRNTIPDYFLCIAFDNIENLTPLYIWMIPGRDVNNNIGIRICESILSKWDKYSIDIENVVACCDKMRNDNGIHKTDTL
jgi:hypothetical protein